MNRWAAVLLVAMACSGAPGTSNEAPPNGQPSIPDSHSVQPLSSLAQPVFARSEHGVDTGTFLAVDGNGAVWTLAYSVPAFTDERFEPAGNLDASATADLKSAFDRLPSPPVGCAHGVPQGLMRVDTDGVEVEWLVCSDAAGAIVEPYKAALDAFPTQVP